MNRSRWQEMLCLPEGQDASLLTHTLTSGAHGHTSETDALEQATANGSQHDST